MVRREDELIDKAKIVERSAGMALTRNPGVAMVWVTRQYEVFKVDNGYLIQMGEPESVEWYAEGRPATRDEIERSISTGLPNLEAVARMEAGGMAALERSLERFRPLLPSSGITASPAAG